MFNSVIRRPWLFTILAFILTVVLVKLNPFQIDLTSWYFVIYIFPVAVFSVWILTEPIFSAKSISGNEKRLIVYEQIYSILRKVLVILGAVLALGVFDKIPLIGNFQNVLIYLSENWSVSVEALEKIIGLLLGIVGQFSSNSRYVVRALVNPRQINL